MRMSTMKAVFLLFRGSTVFYRIFVMTTAVMVFALLISSYYSLNKFSSTMERQMTENVSNVLEQTNKLIDARMDAIIRTSNFIVNEDAIMKILKEASPEPQPDQVEDGSRAVTAMNKFIKSDSGILSAFVLNRDLRLFLPSEDFRSDASNVEQLRDRYWELAGSPYSRGLLWAKTHPVDYSSKALSQEENVFKLIRDIYEDSQTYLGTIVMNIKEQSVYDIFKNINVPKRAIFHIMDKNGIIISGTERNSIGKFEYSYTFMKALLHKQGSFVTEYRGEPHLFVFNKLESADWVTICAIPVGEMLRERDTILRGTILILMLLVIISVSGSLLIAYSISKPVKKLIRATKEVRSGNFQVQADVVSRDEIGDLSSSFNTMVSKINDLLGQLHESHKKEKEAEIRALQSQINPHFLYNTLASVIWLAESKDYDKITDIVSKLGRYYRQSLSRGMEIVRIKQELEHAENYLAIEQIRYGNKFKFEFDVEAPLWNYPCLKLILQPLVENALHHGVLNQPSGSLIRVTGGFLDDKIVIRVEDDGAGIPKERLQEINECFRSGKSVELNDSYGIINVNERLQLKYGREYGLFYKSVAGIGTIVEVWMPK